MAESNTWKKKENLENTKEVIKEFKREYWQDLEDVAKQEYKEEIFKRKELLRSITNFIQPYLHQFFDDSHSLKGYKKPSKNLLIDASHILRQSILAEILSR